MLPYPQVDRASTNQGQRRRSECRVPGRVGAGEEGGLDTIILVSYSDAPKSNERGYSQ